MRIAHDFKLMCSNFRIEISNYYFIYTSESGFYIFVII